MCPILAKNTSRENRIFSSLLYSCTKYAIFVNFGIMALNHSEICKIE